MPVLILCASAWLSQRQVQQQARATIQRAVAVAEGHARNVIETNRQVLDRVNDKLRGLSWEEIFARSAEIHASLAALEQQVPQITALHVVAPDGRLAAISVAHPTPDVNLSDRAYFRHHAAGEAGLVFGEPVVGRSTGKVSFTMSHGRQGGASQEGFDGVVVGAVRPSDFEGYWHALAASTDAHVGLVRADGQMLARFPMLPTPSPRLPEGAALVRAFAEAREGLVLMDPALDGTARLVGFRRVGDYPLFVTYALSAHSVRMRWLEHIAVLALLCAGFSGVLVFAVLGANRRWQIEQEARERLERTADALRAEIARREQVETELRASQRLEALGRLTGGVAHDFNNLLTAILGAVHLLERHLGPAADERSQRLLTMARDGVERGARLNASLLAFARRQPLRLEMLDANALLQGFVPLLQRALGETVTLRLELDPHLSRCRADAAQLEAAVLNLAINARDAMPRGGEVRLRTARVRLEETDLAGNSDAAPGDYALIEMRDTGEGMPSEVQERAFEPFFTTKPVGKGTGLGLSQVFGFVRQIGGHVAIESRPGAGTAIRLYLPAATQPAPAAQEEAPAPELPIHRGPISVLIVEDDEAVRMTVAEAFRTAGLGVLTAVDGQEALSVLRGQDRVDVLFSDIVLPGGMSGVELARKAYELRPGLAALLASGYAPEARGPDTAAVGEFELVHKPYAPEEVARRIMEMVARAKVQQQAQPGSVGP